MSPNSPSLRIGFLPFYVDYYEGICPGFPVEKQAICERLAGMLRERGEVLWDGRMIRDQEQAAAAGGELARQAPDCVVVFTSIAVFSAIPWAALQPLAGPLLVWNAQQIETVAGRYTMEEIVRNTGQIGTQALANTLVREGRPFRVLTGYETAAPTRRGLDAFLGVVRADGIECDVLDLRTLAPLDREGICASVRRTGRLVVAHEGVRTGGVGAEIAQTAIEGAFDFLQAPIIRVTSENLPIPPGTLQDLVFPGSDDVEAAIKKVME